MKKILIITIIGMVMILSCHKETTSPELTDEEAISELIGTLYAPLFEYVGTINDSEAVSDTIATGRKDDPWTVVAWGREILYHTRDILVHIENDTATVTITRDLQGNIHILVQEAEGDTLRDLNKPLHDMSIRIARFVRTGSLEDPYRGWELDGISNVEVNTVDLPDTIDSLEIQYVDVTVYDPADDSTVIFEHRYSDPLALWNTDSIPAFPPDALVRVVLKVTPPSSNVLAFLHYNTEALRHMRTRFTADTTDSTVYYGEWRVPSVPGYYHAGFDIIHRNTFFTEDYPYVSNAWLYLYEVVEEE